MKFNLKKTLASVSALCIVSAMVVPMGASAGQMLGQLDFEQGRCLPWHICESATAEMEFEVSGGTFNVTIVNPGGEARGGEDRWDCQIRHRGLKMRASDTYHLTFELTASNSGQFYTKIGNLNGDVEVWHNGSHNSSDFNNYWQAITVSANQTYKMDVTFTPTEDVDVAEWAFHLGGGGSVTGTYGVDCFPAGTVLKFDNFSLENLSRDDDDYEELPSREMTGISLNQVGYYANRSKKASIATNVLTGASEGTEFTVNDESGTVVYTGTLGAVSDDKDSGNKVALADFSEVRTAGTYTLTVAGVTSDEFDIYETSGGDYQDLTKDALNYFFLNRGNQETEAKYISGGYDDSLVYSSAEEHTQALTITGDKVRSTDTAYIQDIWKNDYAFSGSDVITTKGSIDVTGGWYDAGDYGKYVVNGGISVWTLQNIYENAMANGTTDKWANDNEDIMYIPESETNTTPDILDEAAVELDWFIDCMQRDDGMVYHKTHDYKWTALATLPSQDVGPDGKTQLIRIVKPVTYAATLNLAATGAQGYRVWKDIDSARAEKYLAAAEKAYSAAKALYDAGATTDPTTSEGASLYAPLDQSVGGGPYGDTEVSDDFYWAACELYAATGDETYKTDASKYEDAWEVVTRLNGGENNGSISSFNWGCTASLGSISLALNTLDTVDQDIVDTAKASTVTAAQEYIALENSQGYGIPYTGCDYTDGDTQIIDGYEWGSNSFVVNNAIVMAYAYEFTGDGDYVDGVTTAMDYILGTNPNEISYVTGYGTFALKYPHHRYWSNLLDPTFPLAPAGVLSGGPNSAMQDPYIKGMGYQVNTMAPQKCFIDHIEAWSTNECTINWNSPLAWNVSFMEDYAQAPVGDGILDDYVSGQVDVVSPDDNYNSDSSSVKLDKTTVTVEVGESDTVNSTGSSAVTEWSSADTSVATVDSNGTITGVGEGTTTVTAKDANGNTAKVTVKVTATTTSAPDDTTTTETTTSATDSTTSSSDVDNLWGDANVDGSVKANDLLLLKKHILGIQTLTGQGLANCDVNHDDNIKANDLLKLKKYILGLITQDALAQKGA